MSDREPDFVIDGTEVYCESQDNGEYRARTETGDVGSIVAVANGNYRVLLLDGTFVMRPSKWAPTPSQGLPAEFGSRELALRALLHRSKQSD